MSHDIRMLPKPVILSLEVYINAVKDWFLTIISSATLAMSDVSWIKKLSG